MPDTEKRLTDEQIASLNELLKASFDDIKHLHEDIEVCFQVLTALRDGKEPSFPEDESIQELVSKNVSIGQLIGFLKEPRNTAKQWLKWKKSTLTDSQVKQLQGLVKNRIRIEMNLIEGKVKEARRIKQQAADLKRAEEENEALRRALWALRGENEQTDPRPAGGAQPVVPPRKRTTAPGKFGAPSAPAPARATVSKFLSPSHPLIHENPPVKRPTGPRAAAGGDTSTLKVCIVGTPGVGKTSLASCYQQGVGVISGGGRHYGTEFSKTKEGEIRIAHFDSLRLARINPSWMRGTNGTLLLFDVTNRESFNETNPFITILLENQPRNAPIILVGTKCDCGDERKVTHDEAQEFSSRHRLAYFETSAKENTNVQEVFHHTIRGSMPSRDNPVTGEITEGRPPSANHTSPYFR